MPRGMAAIPPVARRARACVAALWAAIGVSVANVPADVFGLVAVDRGITATTDAEIASANALLLASDTVDLVAGLALVAGYLTGVVFFLRWFHRGHRILRLLLPSVRYSPGWAVGSWFVPFVNLVVPKKASNDLWRAGRRERLPALINWWWAVWLLGSLVDIAVVSGWGWLSAETLEDYRTAYMTDMTSSVQIIVAGVLTVAVVRRTTIRLETLRSQHEGGEVDT